MTCRLFIDEVGNADLKGAAQDDNIRFLSLTGVIMKTGAHARYLQPAIDTLKAVHFKENGDKPVVLHRREILRQEGCFAVLRCPDACARFDADLLKIMEDNPYLVITATIDKREHLERYRAWRFDPYHYCLTCIVERYVNWLERHDLRGDVVAEARFKKVDKKVKASFNRIWSEGTGQVAKGVVQRRLTSKDIKLFNKAGLMAGLELADLLAHPSYRAMKMAYEGVAMPDDFGGRVAGILNAAKYARNPKTRQIEGWGTKWLP